MFSNKRVIIVYPKDYEDLAICLQHEISKLEGFDSTAWILDIYEQNRPTLSGRNHILFIGNSEENKFTKIYMSQITTLINTEGACYGRDGSKAVVFGEGKIEQKSAFEELKEKLDFSRDVLTGNIGGVVALGFICTLPLVFVPGYSLYRVVKNYLNSNELKYEQTKVAIYNFVSKELDNWLSNEGSS